MSAFSTPNERPLAQIQSAASALVAEGNSEEANELTLSALQAVLKENARLELLLKKLRKSNAGKSGSEKLDAEQLSLLLAGRRRDDLRATAIFAGPFLQRDHSSTDPPGPRATRRWVPGPCHRPGTADDREWRHARKRRRRNAAHPQVC